MPAEVPQVVVAASQQERAAEPRRIFNGSRYVRLGRRYSAQNSGRYSTALRCGNQDVSEVTHSDRPVGDPKRVDRSELSGWRSWPYDRDVWVSYNMKIQRLARTPDWVVLGQFHAVPDPGERSAVPPLAFYMSNGALQLATRGNPDLITSRPSTVVQWTGKRFRLHVWHRVVLRIRFSRTGLGHLSAWIDGKLVTSVDTPLGYNDTVGPYWKYGIYRGTARSVAQVRYAGMEIGLHSLQDRVLHPRHG